MKIIEKPVALYKQDFSGTQLKSELQKTSLGQTTLKTLEESQKKKSGKRFG